MGLLDDLRQEQAGRKTVQCRVAQVLGEMDESDAADLMAALADDSIQHVTITNVLRGRGFDMGKHAVATHRRGQCGCAR